MLTLTGKLGVVVTTLLGPLFLHPFLSIAQVWYAPPESPREYIAGLVTAATAGSNGIPCGTYAAMGIDGYGSV